jgi:hypothetical protein
VAATVAVESLWMVAVVALKVAPVAPEATVTDAGTVRTELLLVNVMEAPPLGAACVRATVQVVDESDPRLAGVQSTDETRTEAARFTVVLAELRL